MASQNLSQNDMAVNTCAEDGWTVLVLTGMVMDAIVEVRLSLTDIALDTQGAALIWLLVVVMTVQSSTAHLSPGYRC